MLLQGMLRSNGRLINEQLLLAAGGTFPGAVLQAGEQRRQSGFERVCRGSAARGDGGGWE